MFRLQKVLVIIMCYLTVLYVLRLGLNTDYRTLRSLTGNMMKNTTIRSETETIIIGVTICGEKYQAENAIMMMKSAILFRGELHIHFMIVGSQPLQKIVHDQLEILLDKFGNVFTYELHDIYYPKETEKFWRHWYKECTTERLFYPIVFKNVGLMVHIDNDVLFMNKLSHLWRQALNMNQSQMFGLAPDRLAAIDIKHGHLKYPLHKAPSLNAGIVIMDLKKMVEFGWFPFLEKIVEIYAGVLRYSDQDIFRLTALLHPDKFYHLSCKYNFDTYICQSRVPCKDAETDGIYILHGATNGFQTLPQFKTIMDAFQKYRFGVDPKRRLISLLKNALKSMKNKFCGFSSSVISNNTFKALAAN